MAKNIDIVFRRQQALELRKAGFTYHKIGERLGISAQLARHDVQTALEEDAVGKSEPLTDIELERLDNLYQVAYKKALKGDLKAVEVALKISDRRAFFTDKKQASLPAPVKQKATPIDELKARREARRKGTA